MADEAARMADRWAPAASQSTPVDLDAEMVHFAIRTIGRILFGADVDDAIPVVQATFPILNDHVRRRGLTPLRLPRGWPTAGQRRAARAQQQLYDVVDAIIAQRRNAPSGEDDLISLLLAATDPDTGAQLSSQEVRDQVLLFLLAGHETTSTMLTFTCQLLGSHPEVQRRVQQEVDDVLGGRAPSSDELGNLTYTAMVLNETLRLYPPAPALGRVTSTGDRIGGYDIPPGAIIVVSPWATHRRADVWPDPQRFDPERFAPDAEAARPRYAHFPFAGGPRRCIGAHFAMTEAVTAMATLVAGYTLRSESATVPLRTDVTLHPAGPVLSHLTRRG
jgi:cytochrome P450